MKIYVDYMSSKTFFRKSTHFCCVQSCRVDVCRLKVLIESSPCHQACCYNTSRGENSRSPKLPACARRERAEWRCNATVWRVCANFMCDITLHCWRFTSFSSLLEESRGVAQRRGDECMHVRTYVCTHARMRAGRQAGRQDRQRDNLVAKDNKR